MSDNPNLLPKPQIPLPNSQKITVWLPFLFGLVLAAGMLIGFKMQNSFNARTAGRSGSGRIQEILSYMDAKYVDEIGKTDSIEQLAIEGMLENLDPHSAFIPVSDLQAVNDDLDGDFEGVGIEFNTLKDTINVVQAVSGGPSEKAGIKAGDRIVMVNDTLVAGKKIKQNEVVHKLRGPKGSKVRVGVLRNGVKGVQTFTVTRDKIPTYTVDASYMIAPKVGYVKISKFGEKTYKEFMEACEVLQKDGMTDLMIDLRGNGGGYLQSATKILEQFFRERTMLVYTIGRDKERTEYSSMGKPLFQFGKVTVLIDEGSASASEIMAGALQDHDRATVVGRRSFGKGLVQEQYELSDGSGLRLTVARYYTPAGRCIQKPYKGKKDYDYDLSERFRAGEMTSADSIKQTDTTKFYTDNRRIVYGGGGIMPDIFVPIDTVVNNKYFTEVAGLTSEFAYTNFAQNADALKKQYPNMQAFATGFEVSDEMLERFVAFAEKNKAKRNDAKLAACKTQLKNRIKAFTARMLFGEKGFYFVSNQNDATVRKALSAFAK
jgi:carboxyl-terminal processing protease